MFKWHVDSVRLSDVYDDNGALPGAFATYFTDDLLPIWSEWLNYTDADSVV